MKKLFIIAALFLACIFMGSCSILTGKHIMKIPPRVPNGWQGVRR